MRWGLVQIPIVCRSDLAEKRGLSSLGNRSCRISRALGSNVSGVVARPAQGNRSTLFGAVRVVVPLFMAVAEIHRHGFPGRMEGLRAARPGDGVGKALVLLAGV